MGVGAEHLLMLTLLCYAPCNLCRLGRNLLGAGRRKYSASFTAVDAVVTTFGEVDLADALQFSSNSRWDTAFTVRAPRMVPLAMTKSPEKTVG